MRIPALVVLGLLLVSSVAAAQCVLPDAPTLQGMVSGTTVGLSWTQAPRAVRYRIEAGFTWLAADAATFVTQSRRYTTPVPTGTYYVRVSGINECGDLGPASSDLVVVAPCTDAAPVVRRDGPFVRGEQFRWTLPANTETDGYTVEIAAAPSEPGILFANTGFNGAFGWSGPGPGVYYARVRGRSACGGLLVSNEIAIVVQ